MINDDALARATKCQGGKEHSGRRQANIYESVPTWGPTPRRPQQPLPRWPDTYPLVILSNAADEQIKNNVDKLGAPFHSVYTAEQPAYSHG